MRKVHQSWASSKLPPFHSLALRLHFTFYTQTLGVEGKYLAHVTLEVAGSAEQLRLPSNAHLHWPLWTFSLP